MKIRTLIFPTTVLFLAITFFTGNLTGQQVNVENGIDLYNKGDYQKAIAVLQNSEDVQELYYLGLAYEKAKEKGKAKEILKKCVTNSYDIFFKQFTEWRNNDFVNNTKTFSDFLQSVKMNNEIGYLAAQKAMELERNIFKGRIIGFKIYSLRQTAELARTQEPVFAPTDKSISGFEITQRPGAKMPMDGFPPSRTSTPYNLTVVSLFLVFGGDGEIKLLIPADAVIDGFTYESMKAAGKIEFKPGIKDGNPVSMGAVIKYTFQGFQ